MVHRFSGKTVFVVIRDKVLSEHFEFARPKLGSRQLPEPIQQYLERGLYDVGFRCRLPVFPIMRFGKLGVMLDNIDNQRVVGNLRAIFQLVD